jgi:predicted  nucleic acid-binding Zn-ribbon protein
MRPQFARQVVFALAVLLAVGLCVDEAGAQRRRTRRSRRVTAPVVRTNPQTPVVTPTPSTEPQIISTAEQQAAEAASDAGQTTTTTRRTGRRRAAAPVEEEGETVRRTVSDLSAQVTKLSEQLSQMEQQQRTLVDLERLSRAEQRAEALRAQLQTAQEKETNLSAQLEQIEFDLRPENIERTVSTFGSTHPEDARDARRRGLENQKTMLRAQLDTLQNGRLRLESAIVTADAEVDRLRKRLDDANERPTEATENGDTESTETNAPPTTTTTTEPSTNNPQWQ